MQVGLTMNKLIKYTIYFCLLVLIFWPLSLRAQSHIIVIEQHKDQIIKARQAVRVLNSKILKISEQIHSIKILAIKPGSAEITSGSDKWKIEVLNSKDFETFENLKNLTHNMMGPKILVQNAKVILTGEILRFSDWLKITENMSSQSHYYFQAQLNQNLFNQIQKELLKKLKNSQLEYIKLEVTPKALLYISKQDQKNILDYQELVAPYGIEIKTNSQLIQLSPLIRVKILVAEVRKNHTKELGVLWPTEYEAKLLPSFKIINEDQLSLKIQALEDSGEAHLLASPSLLSRSGKAAEFLAGGEFPIKMINRHTHEVTWKRYGVLLQILPIADLNGKMSISIKTEVSALDLAHKVEGIPALLTNRIESHFNLSSKRTISLSGLLKKDWFQHSEGLPELSNIPILGSLFSSKSYQSHESELFFFVTPEIVQEQEIEENVSSYSK